MNPWTELIDLAGLLAPLSMSMMLFTLGLLSRRLGRVTHAPPYFRGFYSAALLILLGLLVRGLRLVDAHALPRSEWWGILYNGCIALGLTLGVIFAWRYWSWLLAERS